MGTHTIKYLAIIIAGGFISVLLVTCFHLPRFWPRVDGVVLDSASNRPIEGVFVLAVWEGSVPRVVERETAEYRIDVTRTDKEGRFTLPPWLEPPSWISDKYMYLQYYKAGFQPDTWRDYNIRDFDIKGPVFMKKDARPNMERLEYLLIQSNYLGVGSDGSRRKKLFDYHIALHNEAVNLVTSPEESMLLTKIRYYIASEWKGKDTFHTFKEGEEFFKKNLSTDFPGEPKYRNTRNNTAADKFDISNQNASDGSIDYGQYSVQPQEYSVTTEKAETAILVK